MRTTKILTMNDVLRYKGFEDTYCINQECKDWEQGDRKGCKGSLHKCDRYQPFTNLDPDYYLKKATKELESCKISLKNRKHDIPLYKKMKNIMVELNNDIFMGRFDVDKQIKSEVDSLIFCEKRIPELESFITNYKTGDVLK